MDEVAFYNALASNESAARELGDEILKKIAVEIRDKLTKSITVDWQVRESVRAKLRILMRRTLQRYKYPPDRRRKRLSSLGFARITELNIKLNKFFLLR